jgi:hypothetical protein
MTSELTRSNDALRVPRLSRARLRRVAGHSKLLWLLPCFVPVLVLLCAVIGDDPDKHDLARFWAVVTAAFAGVSLLAAYYRHLDRRFLRWLFANARRGSRWVGDLRGASCARRFDGGALRSARRPGHCSRPRSVRPIACEKIPAPRAIGFVRCSSRSCSAGGRYPLDLFG